MYDHIVIGAGVMGASTAYHLSKHSQSVLLIEQFAVPHTRGSSHGQSRGFRRFYKEEVYVKLTGEASKEWDNIERESGQQLFCKTGRVYTEDPPYKFLTQVIPLLEKCDVEFKVLENKEAKEKYPQVNIPEDNMVVYEPNAGVLRAHRCVSAILELFKTNGGELRDECQVSSIEPAEDGVTIITNRGEFRGKNVSVCTGAWSTKLLKTVGLELPIQPLRVVVYYWREKNPGEYSVQNNFPSWRPRQHQWFLLPSLEYPGHVKIAYDGGEECDPDNRDRKTIDNNDITKAIEQWFPGLDSRPSIIETCMYAQTPDEVCILDRHPSHKNIVIATGFSGSGFKIAPAIGKLVSEVARNTEPSFDIEPFRVSRFLN